MKISDLLNTRKAAFASIEIVPPLKGVTKKELLDSIRPFMEFNPPFINVTCHRDEVSYEANPDGSYRRALVRRRVSETAVCAAVQNEFGVEVVPHVICGGSSKDMISAQLQDFKFLGIENILALRGDCTVGEKRFIPEPDGYRYASELVSAVNSFSEEQGYDFCIGVGAYPEKHFEAPNIETDIANLKKKVDAGADYIVTQMFFDNAAFYKFRDKCSTAGINVPIIPGLKPLSSARQIALLPESFSIDIPLELSSEISAHSKDKDACYRIGAQWCSAQCKDLLAHGVPAVHFYTMGRSENIIGILKENF